MPWNAVDALDDARRAATSLLLPFDAGRWLRLVVLAFFVGGGVPSVQWNWNVGSVDVPVDPVPGPGPGPAPGSDGFLSPLFDVAASRNLLLLGLLTLGTLFLVGAVYAAAAAVMEFVLVEALTAGSVRIRGPFRRNLRPGLRLFAFRALLVLSALLVVGLPTLAVVAGGAAATSTLLALLVPLVFFGVAVAVVVWFVMVLTTDFVVPTMVAEGRGVLSAWRRVLAPLRREWQEFGLYLLLRVALGVGASLVVALVVLLAALVVAVPFALVGAPLYLLVGGTAGPAALGPVEWVVLGSLVALYALCLFVVTLVAQVPVVTYFRYYSLFVLGALEGALDLVADRRATDAGGGDAAGTA